jgi:hypothetical protein
MKGQVFFRRLIRAVFNKNAHYGQLLWIALLMFLRGLERERSKKIIYLKICLTKTLNPPKIEHAKLHKVHFHLVH